MCEQVLVQGLALGPHGSAGLPDIGQGLVLPNGSALTPISHQPEAPFPDP